MKLLHRLTMLCACLLMLHILIGAPASAFHMYGGYYGLCCTSEAYIPPAEEPQTAPELIIPPSFSYEVKAGDTMYQISRSFGITVQTLLAANPAVEPNRLSIGQLLQVPAAEAGLQLPDGQINTVSLVLISTLTAYTAGVESTGKTPSHPAYGITSSGSKAEEGRTIAVDPSIIPIGTTVFIDGIGIRTAEDTGSAIRGSRIDVFMDDVQEARQFGVKKNVKVYVLGKDIVRTAS